MPSSAANAREELENAISDAHAQDPGLDLTPVVEARQFLEKCVQEVEYLLQSTSVDMVDQPMRDGDDAEYSVPLQMDQKSGPANGRSGASPPKQAPKRQPAPPASAPGPAPSQSTAQTSSPATASHTSPGTRETSGSDQARAAAAAAAAASSAAAVGASSTVDTSTANDAGAPTQASPALAPVASSSGAAASSTTGSTGSTGSTSSTGSAGPTTGASKRFGDWSLAHTFADQRDSVRAFRFLSSDSLICGADDGTLHWYYGLQADAGAQQLFKGHQGVITSIVHSHANNVVYSAGQDKTVRCWSLSGRGSQRGAGSSSGSGSSHKTTNVLLRGHTDFVWGLDLHDESGVLASCSADCTVRIWDMASHQQVQTLTIDKPECAKAIQFTRAGNQILVGYEDNRVVLFDVESGAPVLRFKSEPPSSASTNSPYLHALAYSASDNAVLSAHLEGVVRQFDVRTGERSAVFAAHDGTVNCVNFSPEGGQFLTGGDEGATKLWSLANPSQPVAVLDRHDSVEGVLDVQWQSPSLIGSSGGDALLKLYRKT